jgi:hypothetical protein
VTQHALRLFEREAFGQEPRREEVAHCMEAYLARRIGWPSSSFSSSPYKRSSPFRVLGMGEPWIARELPRRPDELLSWTRRAGFASVDRCCPPTIARDNGGPSTAGCPQVRGLVLTLVSGGGSAREGGQADGRSPLKPDRPRRPKTATGIAPPFIQVNCVTLWDAVETLLVAAHGGRSHCGTSGSGGAGTPELPIVGPEPAQKPYKGDLRLPARTGRSHPVTR